MKRILSISLFLMVAFSARAQFSNMARAVKHLQKGNLDSARLLIDLATVHESTSEDPKTWYYRGFIYKEIYKQREIKDPSSEARTEALSSFSKSMSLDKENKLTAENKANIRYLAVQFYNDAVIILNENNYEQAVQNFEMYKDAYGLVDSAIDLTQQDIKFNLALATMFMTIYENDTSGNEELFERIKAVYERILEKEPRNVSANYNIGILYYNKAVILINSLDYAIDLVALSQIQDNSIVLFKQSLPYMQHAIDLDPNNINTLTGLAGIYYSLNEFDKSKELKLKIEEIKKEQK